MAECSNYSGNSVVPVLSPDLMRVAIGYDMKQGNDKLFGGGFTQEDAVRGTLTSEAEVAYVCGLRKVEEEAGIVKNQLSLYMQIGQPVVRPVTHRDTGVRTVLSRYTFLAIADKEIILPKHTKGEHEMGNRRFVPIVNVLRAGRLPRNHPEKFNPFHALIVVETLLAVRNMASDGNPAFDQFLLQLHALKQIGFNINQYASYLEEEIRLGRI